jgi:hypothetical protein
MKHRKINKKAECICGKKMIFVKGKGWTCPDNYRQQEKKEISLSMGKHLETRSITGEEINIEGMPVEADIHPADTSNSTKTIQQLNQEIADLKVNLEIGADIIKQYQIELSKSQAQFKNDVLKLNG